MKERQEILRVENLKQYFKLGSGRRKSVNKAVDDISFSIKKGEVFSLVGESGCGKTTTGRTIIKLYKSSGGQVFFEGVRITSDLVKAKAEHKATVQRLTEEKKAALAQLELEKAGLTESEVQEKTKAIEDAYKSQFETSLSVVNEAKKDKHFERHVDKDVIENFEKTDAYKEVVEKYDAMNAEIKDQIKALETKLASIQDPKDQKEVSSEMVKLQKEIKLNAVRLKQDLSGLKYRLSHKNRLLMRRMQMIFQDPIASLNPRMTVKEIVAEGLYINGFKNEVEIDNRVKDALRTVGLLPEHASRYPHEFSGGQRQRIGIARALVVEPSFIIADEPISALDVSIRAQVINLLNDLREQKGITILFIAHDLSVVKYFTDRLAVMYFGKIVEMGDKNAIFNNPLHPYTKSLLESIPQPDPTYERTRKRRPRYIPKDHHDYSVEKPTLREIEPDHFVLCNTEEFEKYSEITKKSSKWNQ